jgi:hypothetical protein
MYFNTKERNRDIDYLEYELEQYREREREQMENDRREREEREHERQELHEERMRTATTWPEALQKQHYLMAQEALLWKDNPPDNYFAPGANACTRAIEIWENIAKEKEQKRAQLKKQLADIDDEIRLETAKKLQTENKAPGWQEIARAIADNDDLNNFLYW